MTKPRDRFEESPNWERVEGELSTGEVELPDAVVDPATLDNASLVDLWIAVSAAVQERGDSIDDSLFEARREAIVAIFGADDEDEAPDESTDSLESDDDTPDAEESASSDESTSQDEEPTSEGDEVAGQTEIEVTASAAKLAEENGIDLRQVSGSGDGGRIVHDDVKAVVAAKSGD